MVKFVVSEDSVITSVFASSSKKFITCGGTNKSTPKDGVPWITFDVFYQQPLPSVGPYSFINIFNSTNFTGTSINYPNTKGYVSGISLDYIKNFLYDDSTKEYICGKFSFDGKNNIMFFNPTESASGDATFNNLSNITFGDPANDIVNCMAFGTDKSQIYIAGKFLNATIGANTSGSNIARIIITPSPLSYNIGTITANAVINNPNTVINSIIVINSILYVAGTDGTNCLFYSYTPGTWTNLLSSDYPGYINVIIETLKGQNIAIGGQFTNLGTATVCNNIVSYGINNTTSKFKPLDVGVNNTGLTSPWVGGCQVFALAYIKNILWVGGYFYNGGQAVSGSTVKNSIAAVSLTFNSNVLISSVWNQVKQSNSAQIGVEYFNDATKPGVVYCFGLAAMDTSVIIVGGSFKISNKFNLVKITIAKPNLNSTTTYNQGSIQL